MAATGVVFLGFIVAHLAGNLQIFLGQDTFNAYAAFLHSIPEVLWPARIVLATALAVHFTVAFSLWRTNKAARPERYQIDRRLQATAASVTMIETGLVLFFFIAVHLLHFTFKLLQPQFAEGIDAKGRVDVYSMVIHGFQNPVYTALYIGCMLMIGVHLSHGFGSMFQTLGFGRPDFKKKADAAGRLFAAAVAFGYISIPLAVWTGALSLPV